jgi:MarR family transcriptional regulator, transcriptional regulator for hemolysin
MPYGSISMETVGRQLYLSHRENHERVDAQMRAVGGSMPQWIVLKTVGALPDMSQRELAAALSLAGSTLTHHLDRLEADGYLVRTRDVADRRVVRVSLTATGKHRWAELDGIVQAHNRRLQELLGERDSRLLMRLLIRLRERLDADLTEGGR